MTFGDLEDGDAFIAHPAGSDNAAYVFFKCHIWATGDPKPNAIRKADGNQSHMPASMPVVKVLL